MEYYNYNKHGVYGLPQQEVPVGYQPAPFADAGAVPQGAGWTYVAGGPDYFPDPPVENVYRGDDGPAMPGPPVENVYRGAAYGMPGSRVPPGQGRRAGARGQGYVPGQYVDAARTPAAILASADNILASANDPAIGFDDLANLLDTVRNAYSSIPTNGGTIAAKQKLKKAIAIAKARIGRAERPYMRPVSGEYGIQTVRQRVPSGTAEGIAMYGRNARVANPDQLRNRAMNSYVGDGAYFGRWLGKAAGGLIPGRFGRLAGNVLGRLGDRAENALLGSDAMRAATTLMAGGDADYANEAIRRYKAGELDDAARQWTGDGAYFRNGPVRGRMDDFDGDGRDDTDYVGARAAKMAAGMTGDDLHGQSAEAETGGRRLHTNQLIDPHALFSRRPPSMKSTDDETGDLVFRHREYIQDITPTSAEFQTQVLLDINPGLAASFPLLSEFAQHFSQYRFEQLIFRFRSLITDGNNTAAGSIMMSTQYNANEAPFATKREIENSEYSVSGKVTDVLDMGVEVNKNKMALGGTFYYIREGGVGDSSHLEYDIGKVQLATQGAAVNLTIGELWAEYVCRLSKLTVTGSRPLALGDGMAIGLDVIAGNTTAASVVTHWVGTSAVPSFTGRLPLSNWRPAVAATGVNTGPQGSLSKPNNNVLLTIDPSLDNSGFTNADQRVITAFSMSRDITASWSWPNGWPTITLVFNSLVGAAYVFKLSQGIHGTQTDVDPTGTLARWSQAPTRVVGGLGTDFGQISCQINSGGLRFPNTTGKTALLTMGMTFVTTAPVPTGTDRQTNVLTTGIYITASTQGQCSISFAVDPNTFPSNVFASSVSWSFTRVS